MSVVKNSFRIVVLLGICQARRWPRQHRPPSRSITHDQSPTISHRKLGAPARGEPGAPTGRLGIQDRRLLPFPATDAWPEYGSGRRAVDTGGFEPQPTPGETRRGYPAAGGKRRWAARPREREGVAEEHSHRSSLSALEPPSVNSGLVSKGPIGIGASRKKPPNEASFYCTSVLAIGSPSFTSSFRPDRSTFRACSRRKPFCAVIRQFSKWMSRIGLSARP